MEEDRLIIEIHNEDDWDLVCPEDWDEKLDSEFDLISFDDVEEAKRHEEGQLTCQEADAGSEVVEYENFQKIDFFVPEEDFCEVKEERDELRKADEDVSKSDHCHETKEEKKETHKAHRNKRRKLTQNNDLVFNEYHFHNYPYELEDREDRMSEDPEHTMHLPEAEIMELIQREILEEEELQKKLAATDEFWGRYEIWDSNPTMNKLTRKSKAFRKIQYYKKKKDGWRDRDNRFIYA